MVRILRFVMVATPFIFPLAVSSASAQNSPATGFACALGAYNGPIGRQSPLAYRAWSGDLLVRRHQFDHLGIGAEQTGFDAPRFNYVGTVVDATGTARMGLRIASPDGHHLVGSATVAPLDREGALTGPATGDQAGDFCHLHVSFGGVGEVDMAGRCTLQDLSGNATERRVELVGQAIYQLQAPTPAAW